MAKSFRSDRRFEQRRHRQQRDAILRAESTPSYHIPEPVTAQTRAREYAAERRTEQEALARQVTIPEDYQIVNDTMRAFNAQRMEDFRIATEMEKVLRQTEVDALSKGLEQAVSAMGKSFIDMAQAFQFVAQCIDAEQLSYSLASISNKYTPTDTALLVRDMLKNFDEGSEGAALKLETSFRASAEKELTVRCVPYDTMEQIEKQSPKTHAFLLKTAADAGISFVMKEEGADLVLAIGKRLSSNRLSVRQFLTFCQKRMSSAYVIRQGMAAQAFKKVVRKTRLD